MTRAAGEILRALRLRAREPYGPEVERDGRPAIGSFCLYAPPEVSLAAGALPIRIRAGAEAEDSAAGDALMSTRTCSFVRKAVSLILDGRFQALEGVVCLNTCDHVRRAFDVIARRAGLAFHGFLSVPRALRPELYPYYLEEVRALHAKLCAHLGRAPDDGALRAAIRTTNAVRARLRELDELRLRARPALSGADALAVQLAAATMPPEAFLPLADELLAALRSSEGLPPPRARLLLCGGELDEPDYVAALESHGALVVADDLCFGSRSAAITIPEEAADPLDAIARATFFRPPCARMIGAFPERHESLRELAPLLYRYSEASMDDPAAPRGGAEARLQALAERLAFAAGYLFARARRRLPGLDLFPIARALGRGLAAGEGRAPLAGAR